MEEGEIENRKGKMPKKQPLPTWFLPLLLVMLITATIIGVPLLQQTRIYIKTYGDSIVDVSVDKPRVPLISTVLQPSYGIGVYTINVTIIETGWRKNLFLQNFTLRNVPSGDYTIIWQNGIPNQGTYTIIVQLFRENMIKDTFTLNVPF